MGGQKYSWVLCGVLLAAAIALKVYPATVLVVPLALRRYRFTFLVTASAFVCDLFPVVFFPGSPGRNVRAGLSALESFKASIHSVAKVSWSLYSVIPNTAGLLLGHVVSIISSCPRDSSIGCRRSCTCAASSS